MRETEVFPDVEKLSFIKSAVDQIRTERKITPTPGPKSEGSCIAARGGEMANMFWAQLVRTCDGSGEWVMLSDPQIVRELYSYVSSLDIFNPLKVEV